MASIPYINPARFAAAGGDYENLIVNEQSATYYWALQAGLADTATEASLTATSNNLTMGGGSSTTGTGPGSSDLTGSVAVNTADTEGLRSTTTYDPDNDWSLSIWAKLASGLTGFYCLWRMEVTSANNYMLLIHRNDEGPALVLQMNTSVGAYCRLTTGTDIRGGGWKHIGVTRDYDAVAANDRIKIYINGSQVANDTRAGIGWTTDFKVDDWMLGAQSDAWNFGWQGEFCAAAFWNGTVLTATDMADQYNKGLL